MTKVKKKNIFRNNNKLDYKDFIKEENKDMIEDLEQYSRTIVF